MEHLQTPLTVETTAEPTAQFSAPTPAKTPLATPSINTYSPFNPGSGLGFRILLGMLPLVIVGAAIDYLVNHSSDAHQMFFWAPATVGIVCLMIIPLALGIAEFYRRKHTLISAQGIEISSGEGKNHKVVLFAWKELVFVNLTNLGPEKFIQLRHANGAQEVLILRHLKDSMDASEFFSAIRAFAPHVSLPAFEKQQLDAAAHTKLWLNSFSQKSDRKARGQLDVGAQLQNGKYIVVSQIAQGGQGTAYQASSDNQTVVLKEYILPMHHFQTHSILTENAEKLNREAEILSRIDHPQIVRVLDHFVEDYRGYLVMNHVQGISLKELVASEGKQPEQVVIDIAHQVCGILAYLHELSPSILHRDVSPDNLILQPDGTVTLVDFNVAHQLDSDATATVVGKHAYIPVEQFKGKPVPASDIYALGCTMYFLLTGEEPEPITPSSPRQLVPGINPLLDETVLRATAFSANNRFATADELRNQLVSIRSTCEVKR